MQKHTYLGHFRQPQSESEAIWPLENTYTNRHTHLYYTYSNADRQGRRRLVEMSLLADLFLYS